jgi:hypothetical protein
MVGFGAQLQHGTVALILGFCMWIHPGGISPPLGSCRQADPVVPDGRLESLEYFLLADQPV